MLDSNDVKQVIAKVLDEGQCGAFIFLCVPEGKGSTHQVRMRFGGHPVMVRGLCSEAHLNGADLYAAFIAAQARKRGREEGSEAIPDYLPEDWKGD